MNYNFTKSFFDFIQKQKFIEKFSGFSNNKYKELTFFENKIVKIELNLKENELIFFANSLMSVIEIEFLFYISSLWKKIRSWKVIYTSDLLTLEEKRNFLILKEYINIFLKNINIHSKTVFSPILTDKDNIIKKNDTFYIQVFQNFTYNDLNNNLIVFKKYLSQIGFKRYIFKVMEQNFELSEINNNNTFNLPNNLNFEINKPFNNNKDFFSLEGCVFFKNKLLLKNKTYFYVFYLFDNEKNFFLVKIFRKKNNIDLNNIEINDWIFVKGKKQYDKWYNVDSIVAIKIEKIKDPDTPYNVDFEEEKRVELHLHTNYSVLDGVNNIKEYMKLAKKMNHKAIAISDHHNVQSFPEVYKLKKKHFPDLKVIYGVEFSLIKDVDSFLLNVNNTNKYLLSSKFSNLTFAILDIETTGFLPKFNEIIEIGICIVKYIGDTFKIIKKYNKLFKPLSGKKITKKIIELTKITDELLNKEGKNIQQEFIELKKILSDHIIVAHNAQFDFMFLKKLFNDNSENLNNIFIDSIPIARALKTSRKKFTLEKVASYFNVSFESDRYHRAIYDVEILNKIMCKMFNKIQEEQKINLNLTSLDNFLLSQKQHLLKFRRSTNHIKVFAKNQQGIHDIYKLVSLSQIKYFYFKTPHIIKEELLKYKDNLVISSPCYNGEIIQNILLGVENTKEVFELYDYIELQPLTAYQPLIDKYDLTYEDIKNILLLSLNLANKNKIFSVATGNVHYINPLFKESWTTLIINKGLGGVFHPLYFGFSESKKLPNLHFLNTKQMLKEFNWLKDDKLIFDLVVKNTNKIVDMIDNDIKPIKENLITINKKEHNEIFLNLLNKYVKELYGENLNPIVKKRINIEKEIIISHNFAIIYLTAHDIVQFSWKEKFLVGSRGSVGSSLIAFIMKISEVNPLTPHYLCKVCKYIEFSSDINFDSGFDLPNKKCNNCKKQMLKDGHNIPYETFFGLGGERIPDIDLNFSSEFKDKAHNKMKEYFGENKVFRSGTISKVADRTAFALVKKYEEFLNITFEKLKFQFLISSCTNVKRTTGQHPGGIIIIPDNYDVLDFTPYNYPADDHSSTWFTTHFDYSAIKETLFKFDFLGHDDPTILRKLELLTKVDPKSIEMCNKKILSIFSKTNTFKVLNISNENSLVEKIATIGIPEFGTFTAKKILFSCNPKSFSELVKISGLTHGINVWSKNAEMLIKENKYSLKNLPACRDDIMTYLLEKKLDPKIIYSITESVRKGKGLTEEWKKLLKNNNIPDDIILYFEKIQYLFPKAHATAYVIMAYRIAWYKINYPYEFYAILLSTRCPHINLEILKKGKSEVIKEYNNLYKKNTNYKTKKKTKLTPKEENYLLSFEVILEMMERNINFEIVNINHSHHTNFIIKEINNKKTIYFPFIIVEAIGPNKAKDIYNARLEKEFINIEDFKKRTKINIRQLKILKSLNLLNFEN